MPIRGSHNRRPRMARRTRRVRGSTRSTRRRGGKVIPKINTGPTLRYSGPGPAPFPDKYMTKVRYGNWFNNASAGSTGMIDVIYKGNDIYDVGGSGDIYSVSAFAQFLSLYQQYRVYASKIKVTLKSLADTTALGDAIVYLTPDRSSTSYTMSDVILRQTNPFAKTVMCNRYGNGNNPVHLKAYRKSKNIYGQSNIEEDDFASNFADPPVNAWFWHLCVCRGDKDTGQAYPGFQLLVRITYYIRFEKRKALTLGT